MRFRLPAVVSIGLAALALTSPGQEAASRTHLTARDGSVRATPYAEWFGDRRDLALAKDGLEVIAKVKKAGIPVVVVLLSGRPPIITDSLPMLEAFVAAWLPAASTSCLSEERRRR